MALLRLFAQAREAAGMGSVEVEGETVGDALAVAEKRFGHEFSLVLAGSKVWVNGEPADLEDLVGRSDEIAVLPPVSGG